MVTILMFPWQLYFVLFVICICSLNCLVAERAYSVKFLFSLFLCSSDLSAMCAEMPVNNNNIMYNIKRVQFDQDQRSCRSIFFTTFEA